MIVSNPQAALLAVLATSGQVVQAGSSDQGGDINASFLRLKRSLRRGTPQCFGQIQYRPRKSQGVYVRKASPLSR